MIHRLSIFLPGPNPSLQLSAYRQWFLAIGAWLSWTRDPKRLLLLYSRNQIITQYCSDTGVRGIILAHETVNVIRHLLRRIFFAEVHPHFPICSVVRSPLSADCRLSPLVSAPAYFPPFPRRPAVAMFRCLPVSQLQPTSSARRRLSSSAFLRSSYQKLRYRSSNPRIHQRNQKHAGAGRPRGHSSSSSHSSTTTTSFTAAAVAVAAVSGGLLATMVAGWERDASGVRCESSAAAAAAAIKQPSQGVCVYVCCMSAAAAVRNTLAVADLSLQYR